MTDTATALEPFEMSAPSEALDDLSRRLRAARLLSGNGRGEIAELALVVLLRLG